MTAPDDVRARFEAWAKSQRYYVDRAAHGFYKSCRTHDAWEGYRAAHADLSGEVRELVDADREYDAAITAKWDAQGIKQQQAAEKVLAAAKARRKAALAKFTHQEKP